VDGNGPGPLVSIVLPTYNGARYIGEAIESCLGQTYPNWELIIVDDGSTDGTVDAVKRYRERDRRLRLLRHERNRYLPAALNTGFADAAGCYLTWIADDNVFRHDAIEELVSYLEVHPDVDVVYTDCTLTDDEGKPYERLDAGEPERLWSTDFNCVGPCFLYRRRVHSALGGYAEDMFLVEDYDFWLRASQSFRLRPYHKDLFCYRRHPGSLSSRFNPRIEHMLDRALARHLPGARMAGAAKSAVFFLLAQRARSRGEALPTLTYLASSWVHSPRVFAQYLGRAAQRRAWRRLNAQ
jgi:glycosyltransferase involved in cell wall biosynthesis